MWLMSVVFSGCGEPEPAMCSAICMAEHSYVFSTEMEQYVLEASVSSFTQTENVSFEFTGTEEEAYGESTGVIFNLKSTGFDATSEYELSLDSVTINGQEVEVEQTETREKEECGGACEANKYSISNTETSSTE